MRPLGPSGRVEGARGEQEGCVSPSLAARPWAPSGVPAHHPTFWPPALKAALRPGARVRGPTLAGKRGASAPMLGYPPLAGAPPPAQGALRHAATRLSGGLVSGVLVSEVPEPAVNILCGGRGLGRLGPDGRRLLLPLGSFRRPGGQGGHVCRVLGCLCGREALVRLGPWACVVGGAAAAALGFPSLGPASLVRAVWGSSFASPLRPMAALPSLPFPTARCSQVRSPARLVRAVLAGGWRLGRWRTLKAPLPLTPLLLRAGRGGPPARRHGLLAACPVVWALPAVRRGGARPARAATAAVAVAAPTAAAAANAPQSVPPVLAGAMAPPTLAPD